MDNWGEKKGRIKREIIRDNGRRDGWVNASVVRSEGKLAASVGDGSGWLESSRGRERVGWVGVALQRRKKGGWMCGEAVAARGRVDGDGEPSALSQSQACRAGFEF